MHHFRLFHIVFADSLRVQRELLEIVRDLILLKFYPCTQPLTPMLILSLIIVRYILLDFATIHVIIVIHIDR
jgi:hypothetical protein